MGIFTIETFSSVYDKSGLDFSIFSVLGFVITLRAKKAKFQFQALRLTKWKKEVPQWPMAPKYEVSKVKMPIFLHVKALKFESMPQMLQSKSKPPVIFF